MRTILKLVLALGLMFGSSQNLYDTLYAQEVEIPDDAFRECVMRQLSNETSSAITQELLETRITDLVCNGDTLSSKIEDISGIEYMTNLENVSLIGNNISDFSKISELNNLKKLNIRSNTKIDTSTLKDFPALTTLIISYTDLSTLEWLSNIDTSKIEILDFTQSNLTSLNGLGKYPTLEELNLNENNIESIEEISDLTNLESLSMYQNNLNDISGMKNLPNLEFLDFGSNNISDITALKEVKSLKRVLLDYNQITDITPIESLTNLTSILLSNNHISSLNIDWNHPNLGVLALSYNNIYDISPLKNLNHDVLSWLELNGQVVTLPDEIFYESVYEVESIVKDLEEATVEYENNSPEIFEVDETKQISNSWEKVFYVGADEFSNGFKVYYNGEVNQKVTAKAPQTTITGKDAKTYVGEELSDNQLLTLLDVKAYDVDGSDITNKVYVIESNIDYSKQGTYSVTVGVTDRLGNEVTKELSVVLEEKTVIESILPKTGYINNSIIGFVLLFGLFKIKKYLN